MFNLPLLSADFLVRETTFAVGSTPVPIAKQDPTRWAIIFSAQPGVAVVAVSTTSTPGAAAGIQLPNAGGIVDFHFRAYGGLVSLPWYAAGVGGSTSVTVIEVLYRPEG